MREPFPPGGGVRSTGRKSASQLRAYLTRDFLLQVRRSCFNGGQGDAKDPKG